MISRNVFQPAAFYASKERVCVIEASPPLRPFKMPVICETQDTFSIIKYLLHFLKNYGKIHITKFIILTVFKYTVQ